jgi:hypothetical protein
VRRARHPPFDVEPRNLLSPNISRRLQACRDHDASDTSLGKARLCSRMNPVKISIPLFRRAWLRRQPAVGLASGVDETLCARDHFSADSCPRRSRPVAGSRGSSGPCRWSRYLAVEQPHGAGGQIGLPAEPAEHRPNDAASGAANALRDRSARGSTRAPAGTGAQRMPAGPR